MDGWKRRNRSFYYADAPAPDDPDLSPATTALLVIDVQNTYLTRPRARRCTIPPISHATMPGRRSTSACTAR